uniref:Uncharacterized protein n=1 Tax=Nelumbo nucifera TaxID=4432 RepID=A0A822Y3T8_NELNU|nr:TPA_asm: hypothetical protein HUJ06_027182 [Nelumbo nucifera]
MPFPHFISSFVVLLFRVLALPKPFFNLRFQYHLIRWSLIAGRIAGRTAEEIEKYWTSRYSTSE